MASSESRNSDAIDDESIDLDDESFPLDRYKPIALIGRGTVGSVYLSRDRLLGKLVAVKTLHVLTADQLVRFQDEARATSRLNHHNIVNILDFGATEAGTPYMVLEYMPGVSVAQYLREHKTMDCELAIDVVARVCDALTSAHNQGVFHRDLKPSNILLSNEGTSRLDVRLIDFGVAHVKEHTISDIKRSELMQGRTVVGTPGYMSPDQVLGKPYDRRSEIYSLGCVLFEMICGRPPFVAETAMETLSMHAHDTPPRLAELSPAQVPDHLIKVVERCLEKNAAERYQSALELKESLLFRAGNVDLDEKKDGYEEQVPGMIIRPRSLILLSVSGLVVLFVACYVSLSLFEKQSREDPLSFVLSPTLPADLKDISYPNSPVEERVRTVRRYGREWSKVAGIVTREDLLDLLASTELEYVEFAADDFRGDALKPLSEKPLVGLRLSRCKLDDRALSWITSIDSLEMLALAGCEGVSSRGLRRLRALPKLKTIDLSRSSVDDEVVRLLSKFEALETLDLHNCDSISGKTIPLVKSLKSLSLSYSSFKIKYLAKLRSLPELRILYAAGLGIDDREVGLLPIENLTRLDLSDNEIGDRGLRKLAAIARSMERLNVLDNPGITGNGIRGLGSSLPNCRVLYSSERDSN